MFSTPQSNQEDLDNKDTNTLGTTKLDHWELDIWKQSPQPHHHQSPTAIATY